jgi:hypothetical protein
MTQPTFEMLLLAFSDEGGAFVTLMHVLLLW